MKSAPGSAREIHPLAPTIVSVLSSVILFGGLATVAVALYMVVLCYTSLPWSDGWSEIAMGAAGGNLFSVPRLWLQHNEHRLLIPHLLLALDLRLFGASQKLLLTIVFLVQSLHLYVLSWSMRALGGWRGPLLRTGTGLAAFCLFCPTQWENLTWGFQTCFVLPPLFATVSFVALLLYWRKQPSKEWKLIVVSVIAALVAVCSLANGLLVLPLLGLAAFALRMRRRVVFTYFAAALMGTALYFWGYVWRAGSSEAAASLRSPAKLAAYVATYLGSSWTRQDLDLEVAPYLGLLGLAVLLALLLRFRNWQQQSNAWRVELFLIALFCLGTALLTALGRATSGDAQAFASRYQTIALLFWWSLACLLLAAARGSSKSTLAVHALLVMVLVRGAVLVRFPLRDAREHDFQQRAAAAALLSGVDDREQIASSYADPDYVERLVPFMRAQHLSIFAERTDLGTPVSTVAQTVGRERCQGELQSVTPVGDDGGKGMRIAGWAWDLQAHKPATGILVVSSRTVVGMGATGDWRPEIRARRPYMNTSFIGFTAYAKSMPAAPITVYAVLPGNTAQVCDIAVVPR